jgi:hypothetical protein
MAAPHKSPSTLRSPRNIALEKGTSAAGFHGDHPSLCIACGYPSTETTPCRCEPHDDAQDASNVGSRVANVDKSPFKLGGV